jgi:hypothetical protein
MIYAASRAHDGGSIRKRNRKGEAMRARALAFFLCIGIGSLSAVQTGTQNGQKKELIQYVETETGRWMVHDVNRPAPPVITPGSCGTGKAPGAAPSDAIVLFDGRDLTNWTDDKGEPSKWVLRNGYMESAKGAGFIRTRQLFGSCQLHIEFATPSLITGSGQGRGNSGVFLQGMYEIQVLDSFDNPTYPDGQCGALYGQAVPLVNACCKPGQWQSFDVVYHRPQFDPSGKVVRRAIFTVFQNGVLIQDHVELQGGTNWISAHAVTGYVPHDDRGPLKLQDHNNPVRFRNIWIRELN